MSQPDKQKLPRYGDLGSLPRRAGRRMHDQQTLPLQMRAMREYAVKRGWTNRSSDQRGWSGAAERGLREKLLAASGSARDRCRAGLAAGSLAPVTRRSGRHVEGTCRTGFTEALDLTTATGRAMTGLLSVFAECEHEILRERIRAGNTHVRPSTPQLSPQF